MKKTYAIAAYALALAIVLILGALTGWYFFLHRELQATQAENAARGYPSAASAQSPGMFARIYDDIFGGESASPAPAASSPASGPFGANGNPATGTDFTSGAGGSTIATSTPPRLWHAYASPIAGMTFARTSTEERLYFVERATGYVVEADPETGAEARLTDTLMPKIYEAIFDGTNRVIERSIDGGAITTFDGTFAPAATSAQPLSGTYLAKNISELAADPRSGDLFYLAPAPGGIAGFRARSDGLKQKQTFSSAVLHWRAAWLSDGRIILEEPAADGVAGHAYALASDGTLSPLAQAPGLTLLPRPGSGALIWGQSSGQLSLFAKLDASTAAAQLPVQTVADKCAWAPSPVRGATASNNSGGSIASNGADKDFIAYCGAPQTAPSGNFLDDWYKGETHTADAIWKIDASAGSAEILYTPPPDTPLDVKDPIADSGGSYLAFIDASDDSLWLLRLKQ